MDGGESVGMVLSRVAELRSKITGCIHKATADCEEQVEEGAKEEDEGSQRFERLGCGEEEEAESLFGIRDALDSLEEQLASLQALHEQQLYERESTLAEIDQGRKILLKKLKEYKGDNLEVIQEASAFAGGNVENGTDLFLPPYPTRLPESMIYEGRYRPLPSSSNGQLPFSNHVAGTKLGTETKMNGSELKLIQPTHPAGEKKPESKIKTAIGLAAKAVFALAGVVSVLTIARFQPRSQRRGLRLKAEDLLPRLAHVENIMSIQCPVGKVLVMEDGVPRCIVKERVEVPFESAVKSPDVSYGFG